MPTCPRCHVATETIQAFPGRGPSVALDICGSCRGLWIEARKLPFVCPTLSDLPDRRFEVTTLGREGGGIARCPGCDAVPFEFNVLETSVDFCARCGGVWMDADEYGEPPSSEIREEARPDVERGPYRSRGRSEGKFGEVACASCTQVTRVPDSFMLESGLVCAACFEKVEEREKEARADASKRGGVFGILDALLRELTS